MFSPEEFLKLPAGDCIFINPAYANAKEASIPVKLKVKVGDGEIQRRTFGEANFNLVIKELKNKILHQKITSNDIYCRIAALNKVIPFKPSKNSNNHVKNFFVAITNDESK
jgi:hypothetical protein